MPRREEEEADGKDVEREEEEGRRRMADSVCQCTRTTNSNHELANSADPADL